MEGFLTIKKNKVYYFQYFQAKEHQESFLSA